MRFTWHDAIRDGPEYLLIQIFIRRVGIQCKFWYSNNLFFFFTPGIPLKWEVTSHSRLNMNRPWVNVMIQFIWKRRYKCRRPRLCVSTLNWVRTRQRQCAKYAIWNWPATTAHQVWKIISWVLFECLTCELSSQPNITLFYLAYCSLFYCI